jgi:hypothetical protein
MDGTSGVIRATVEIKRAATGQVEVYDLVLREAAEPAAADRCGFHGCILKRGHDGLHDTGS